MKKKINIGIGVEAPASHCDDRKCPFHGGLRVRGRIIAGTIVSAKFARSPVVEWYGQRFVPRFERYEKTRTRVHVHNPPCINAKVGDKVRVAECRQLSKTKNFVVVERLGADAGFALRAEGAEEAKFKVKEPEEVKG